MLRSLVNIPRQMVGTRIRAGGKTGAGLGAIHRGNVDPERFAPRPSLQSCAQLVLAEVHGIILLQRARSQSIAASIFASESWFLPFKLIRAGYWPTSATACKGAPIIAAVQHHADAQSNFRGTTLRLAFGRAKIFSRPRHHVGFSD